MSDEQSQFNQPPTVHPIPPGHAGGPGWNPPPWSGGPWGPPPGGAYWQPAPAQPQPVRKSGAGRVIFWLFLILILGGSILLNLVLLASQVGDLGGRGSLATRTVTRGASNQTIAVYDVNGVITGATTAQFKQFYRAVIRNSDVKAVVLRIDSPGGGVTSSDQICEMVKKIQASGRKVVVSMGSLAASGAYYISAPADEIYAEDTTITGSIGVITEWFVFKGTLEKIGAQAFTVKSTHAQDWKDEMSPTLEPQKYQLEHIQGILDQMQKRFEGVVKAGRGTKIKPETVTVTVHDKDGKAVEHQETKPFNGKIYLADEAKHLGLIDKIGYEQDAINGAATLASLTRPNVVRYARRRTFMEDLLGGKTDASLKVDAKLIDQLQTPKFMMLWKAE